MYPFLLTLITFLEVPLGSSKPDTVSKFSVMLFTSNTFAVPASLPESFPDLKKGAVRSDTRCSLVDCKETQNENE